MSIIRLQFVIHRISDGTKSRNEAIILLKQNSKILEFCLGGTLTLLMYTYNIKCITYSGHRNHIIFYPNFSEKRVLGKKSNFRHQKCQK